MEACVGSSVHRSLYEKAMDQLEQIVDADPDYESDSDAEFIGELSDMTPNGFTTDEVKRIERIFKKYCGEK